MQRKVKIARDRDPDPSRFVWEADLTLAGRCRTNVESLYPPRIEHAESQERDLVRTPPNIRPDFCHGIVTYQGAQVQFFRIGFATASAPATATSV